MSTSPSFAVPDKGQETVRLTNSGLGLTSTQSALTLATDDRGSETESGLKEMLFDLGVEPTLTVHEAATILRWSYFGRCETHSVYLAEISPGLPGRQSKLAGTHGMPIRLPSG